MRSYNLHKLLTLHHLGALYSCWEDAGEAAMLEAAPGSRVRPAQAGPPAAHTRAASRGLASMLTLACCCQAEGILL